MRKLTEFSGPGQRVRIDNPDAKHAALAGKIAHVTRVTFRGRGYEAWVNVEDGLPDNLRSFPAADPHGRGNHICLFADECTEVAR